MNSRAGVERTCTALKLGRLRRIRNCSAFTAKPYVF